VRSDEGEHRPPNLLFLAPPTRDCPSGRARHFGCNPFVLPVRWPPRARVRAHASLELVHLDIHVDRQALAHTGSPMAPRSMCGRLAVLCAAAALLLPGAELVPSAAAAHASPSRPLPPSPLAADARPPVLTAEQVWQWREESREMLQHAFRSYMRHGWPWDEVRPLQCTGRRWNARERGDLDDSLGGFALTLIDSLDALAVIGDLPAFRCAVSRAVYNVSVAQDASVSVFETTIRVVGGLLSAHLLASDPDLALWGGGSGDGGDGEGLPCADALNPCEDVPCLPRYEGQLLHMADEVTRRLLPAFDTPTGLPYHRINLRTGVVDPVSRETCTAAAGTFLVEFGLLSRLTGDPTFEAVARRAVTALWQRRSSLGLVGSAIDAVDGNWRTAHTGVGGGIDSWIEYLLKAGILLDDDELVGMHDSVAASVRRHVQIGGVPPRPSPWPTTPAGSGVGADADTGAGAGASGAGGPVFIHGEVSMTEGRRAPRPPHMASLAAFYPGLEVLAGAVGDARTHYRPLAALWSRLRVLPEDWAVPEQAPGPYGRDAPLRPELIESAYHLFTATRDPSLVVQAAAHLTAINEDSRVPCGYASVADVTGAGALPGRRFRLDDRMDSYFIAETAKYLFLTFDHALWHWYEGPTMGPSWRTCRNASAVGRGGFGTEEDEAGDDEEGPGARRVCLGDAAPAPAWTLPAPSDVDFQEESWGVGLDGPAARAVRRGGGGTGARTSAPRVTGAAGKDGGASVVVPVAPLPAPGTAPFFHRALVSLHPRAHPLAYVRYDNMSGGAVGGGGPTPLSVASLPLPEDRLLMTTEGHVILLGGWPSVPLRSSPSSSSSSSSRARGSPPPPKAARVSPGASPQGRAKRTSLHSSATAPPDGRRPRSLALSRRARRGKVALSSVSEGVGKEEEDRAGGGARRRTASPDAPPTPSLRLDRPADEFMCPRPMPHAHASPPPYPGPFAAAVAAAWAAAQEAVAASRARGDDSGGGGSAGGPARPAVPQACSVSKLRTAMNFALDATVGSGEDDADGWVAGPLTALSGATGAAVIALPQTSDAAAHGGGAVAAAAARSSYFYPIRGSNDLSQGSLAEAYTREVAPVVLDAYAAAQRGQSPAGFVGGVAGGGDGMASGSGSLADLGAALQHMLDRARNTLSSLGGVGDAAALAAGLPRQPPLPHPHQPPPSNPAAFHTSIRAAAASAPPPAPDSTAPDSTAPRATPFALTAHAWTGSPLFSVAAYQAVLDAAPWLSRVLHAIDVHCDLAQNACNAVSTLTDVSPASFVVAISSSGSEAAGAHAHDSPPHPRHPYPGSPSWEEWGRRSEQDEGRGHAFSNAPGGPPPVLLHAGGAQFGPLLTTLGLHGMTAALANPLQACTGPPSLVIHPPTGGGGPGSDGGLVAAVVVRGGCSFATKARHAQMAGARVVIVVDIGVEASASGRTEEVEKGGVASHHEGPPSGMTAPADLPTTPTTPTTREDSTDGPPASPFVMADDGHGSDIEIPALFVGRPGADSVLAALGLRVGGYCEWGCRTPPCGGVREGDTAAVPAPACTAAALLALDTAQQLPLELTRPARVCAFLRPSTDADPGTTPAERRDFGGPGSERPFPPVVPHATRFIGMLLQQLFKRQAQVGEGGAVGPGSGGGGGGEGEGGQVSSPTTDPESTELRVWALGVWKGVPDPFRPWEEQVG
jgi:hypothetical protein